ncbi:MAG: AAA family ATPase, partial [Pseudomonadota bacterium]
ESLEEAFAEVDALSKATQCQKYLFSLSLNPPPHESVPVEVFEAAIERIADQLGLASQPRVIVFHEKDERRHAHCVWSRIDRETIKAINLPHFKRKLMAVSRELYMEHGWDMPAGFEDFRERDPLNYSRQEAQQAKRLDRDPKALKALFKSCWERSDSRQAFAAALLEHGFVLAKGQRRAFVAVDADGKIWSLSRWCGVKPKLLKLRLGEQRDLPSIDEAKAQATLLQRPAPAKKAEVNKAGLDALVAQQRREREALKAAHQLRQRQETLARNAKVPRGMALVWARLSGAYGRLADELAQEKAACDTRDRAETQQLIDKHLRDRRALARNMQKLRLPQEKELFCTAQIRRDPTLILRATSEKKATFDANDIKRGLAKHIKEFSELQAAIETVLASPELVRLSEALTTRYYLDAEQKLLDAADRMALRKGHGVASDTIKSVIAEHNADMQRRFGGKLSDEQVSAIHHVLGDKQLSQVVGLAGAGKSTMLAAAFDAWTKQGVKVHGAALSGKAADGLQNASGMQSRTLASLELSWKNGHQPIKRGDVLVIDEAGMIGTRQMQRLMTRMEEIGAKLVLVGDPNQLQPIEAGTPFRKLVEAHGAVHLKDIYRQKDDWQKQASRDLAESCIADAVKTYEINGSVHHSDHRDESLAALVNDYMADLANNGADTSRLAFAHRREDVHALNQAIRDALQDAKRITDDTIYLTETGYRAFAKGERIVFTQNDRAMGVKNGMLGTVIHADEHGLKVLLDSDDGKSNSKGREVSINPHQYRSFDHGYAVTIHKSQGATVDRSYVLASKSMDSSLAYVAMTRHRDDMKLYLNAKDRPKWMADHAPQPDLTHVQVEPSRAPTQEPPQPDRPSPTTPPHTRKRNGPER